LVINKMKAWQGSMGIAPTDGIVSPAYFVYDLRVSNRMFGQALLRSRPYVAHFAQASDGVRVGQWDLSINRMREIPVLLPPPEEQEAIVRFLDHANRRIDQFIRSKKKLIALLNEQKQAIIHRAVTRGLDPGVKLKDSGVPWIGQIPAHWDVRRLKTALRGFRNGVFKRSDDFGAGYPLVNVKDLFDEGGWIDARKLELVRASENEVSTFRVSPGDLFFVRSSLKLEGTGMCAIIGDCPDDTIFECHVVRARPNPGVVSSEYMAMYLRSWAGRNNAISRANTVTMSTLSQGVLGDLPIILPPLLEQRDILNRVAHELKPLNGPRAAAEQQLVHIREYRTRLISDVVTGQLDVRAAAASLPAVEPEADLPDTENDETDPDDGETA